MAAGEGGRGTLARGMSMLHELIEPAVGPAGHGHHGVVSEEIVADGREQPLSDGVGSHSKIVVLGAGHGQEDENSIEQEEGGEYDEGGAQELLIALKEIIEGDDDHEQEIAGVAEVHKLAPHRPREPLAEEQGWLAAEERLLEAGKEVVEIGEYPVQGVGVGIPP